RITAPPNGQRVAGAVEVTAVLDLDGVKFRNDPPSLELSSELGSSSGPSATLTLIDAGLYQGTWTASAEGSYALRATYAEAGLTSAATTVLVDQTPPTLGIIVQPPPRPTAPAGLSIRDPFPGYSDAWRRDEVGSVKV